MVWTDLETSSRSNPMATKGALVFSQRGCKWLPVGDRATQPCLGCLHVHQSWPWSRSSSGTGAGRDPSHAESRSLWLSPPPPGKAVHPTCGSGVR